jgi:hypothetical protein
MNTRLRLATLIALFSFYGSKSQAATTVYDSNGFEPPTFATGALVGQDGWVDAGNGTAATVISSASAPGTTPLANGTQVVQIDRVNSADVHVARPTPISNVASSPNGSHISVEWTMSYEASDSGGFGPFLGVQLYDETSGTPYLLAAAGVDATTFEVLYQDANSDGALNIIPDGGGSIGQTPQEWMAFRLDLDYTSQTYDLLLDGALVLNDQDFVDKVLAGGALNGFSDADIVALAAGKDDPSQAASGRGYFDNLRITQSSGNVPDAGSTGALLATALATLGWVRRRR